MVLLIRGSCYATIFLLNIILYSKYVYISIKCQNADGFFKKVICFYVYQRRYEMQGKKETGDINYNKKYIPI